MGSAFSTGSGPLFQSVASVPPSTGRHTPVIEAEASEHSYRAAPITPSRAPKRRMGIFTPPAPTPRKQPPVEDNPPKYNRQFVEYDTTP